MTLILVLSFFLCDKLELLCQMLAMEFRELAQVVPVVWVVDGLVGMEVVAVHVTIGGQWVRRGVLPLSRERYICLVFFFSSRRRHTRFDCDWSSDVCSSD